MRRGIDPSQSEFAELLRRYGWLLDDIERGYDDCIEEYENDVDTRTLLQRMLEAGFRPTPAMQKRLADLDARFRSLLGPIAGALGLGNEDADVYFWWYGLPRTMAGELLLDATRRGLVRAGWPAAGRPGDAKWPPGHSSG